MKDTRTIRGLGRLRHDAGLRSVLVLFGFWKALLLLVAIASPGVGYDTSSSLLLHQHDPRSAGHATDGISNLPLLGKLVRWDAIYLMQSAQRGYQFEQEWAFGTGFPTLVNVLTSVFEVLSAGDTGRSPLSIRIGVAVALAHLSHLLAVVLLYHLTLVVFRNQRGKDVAFLAASLHILSPAGPFLSAPYGESLFAALSFFGLWLYALSLSKGSGLGSDALVVLSGLIFGLSVTVRSNGILNGLFFLYDVVHRIGLPPTRLGRMVSTRTLALGLAGLAVLMGGLIPQAIAYAQFCQDQKMSGLPRPWCSNTIPSIYTWVQMHYWNVGFLRYWTVSNLPLFLIAAPMLAILWASSMWALQIGWGGWSLLSSQRTSTVMPNDSRHGVQPTTRSNHDRTRIYLQRAVLPQLLLTVLAVSNYHVQIINRISSGYAVWYWWLASAILDDSQITVMGRTWNVAQLAVRWMIIYALIQTVLFASFLPPA
ncbi:MAG: hypothetical protein M1823_003556 [Watsoniomyces obsoletus]|nr:MAG: hypothetical protein M1823_003556 [Watsoniomyces obsoletus]